MQRTVTRHAQVRQQQRGIQSEHLKALDEYGRSSYANGAVITDLDRLGLARYQEDNPSCNKQSLHKFPKIYMVEIEGVLITVAFKKPGWRKKFSS